MLTFWSAQYIGAGSRNVGLDRHSDGKISVVDGSGNDTGDLLVGGVIGHGAAGSLTISSGAVAVTKTYHTIVAEGAPAVDTLVTATGGSEGDILILRANDSADTITIQDGTGADTFILAIVTGKQPRHRKK